MQKITFLYSLFLAGRGNFTLEIFDRSKHNTTILFKKEFNDVINYGHSVVFFTNVTAVLADASHRIIRFTPHIKMRICEIEASFIKGISCFINL